MEWIKNNKELRLGRVGNFATIIGGTVSGIIGGYNNIYNAPTSVSAYKEVRIDQTFNLGEVIGIDSASGLMNIGVNNRNLKDFTVDIENSINLRRCVSGDVVFISESGIKTPDDVRRLKENDVDAVLIGETLMKCDDKKSMISELKNG